ncbi:hypothetical protein [Lutibacter sp.]
MKIEKENITLTWKKGFLSNLIEINSKSKLIGKLSSKSFSDSTDVELENKKYRFFKRGIFESTTLISDLEDNKIIGRIIYDSIKTKAYLELYENKYTWKSESFWTGKWSLSNQSEKLIDYKSNLSNGVINSITNDTLLILMGLHITNNYLRGITFFLIIILIPILTIR